MTDIPKMDLKSMDIAEDKRQALKQIFPEVFTEKKIDFEKLKSVLGELIETGKERYGMNWPGKADCMKIIQRPSVGTLKPCREESVDFDATENLFIEGDNLEVLKLLQKSYYNKVKMIYIDPPYNTGNEFVYPDDYSESLDTYLKYTGQVDNEGKKFSTNVESDGRFHSKWMNMMYPRLYLARNLLKEDGVIFISIDDNEVSNLRKICDDVFGEENFIAKLVWKRRASSAMADNMISVDHEYVLIYTRGFFKGFYGLEKDFSGFKNPDNDPRGDWVLGDLTVGMTKEQRPNQFYELKDPQTGNIYSPNPSRVWAYIPISMKKLIDENCIFFPDSTDKRPMIKRFKKDLENKNNPISSLIPASSNKTDSSYFSGLNTEGTKIIQELFDSNVFNYSKPVSLISSFIHQTLDKNEIVLDFFAGSCPLAQSIFENNCLNNKNNKFIVIQLPESTNQEEYKTIADIGKERIRRVIKKIREEKENQLDFDKDKKLDLGFKVFKLDKSNFKVWDAESSEKQKDLESQLELHIDHINPSSTQEDILYELLMKAGFPLTTSIEKLNIDHKTVYSISDGALFICLEQELTKELFKAIADKSPVQVICLDAGFHGNDQLKTNVLQIMKTKEIEFRTV